MLAELSELVRSLPPEKLSQMQSLMHNAMGGFDTRKEMAEFENSLPPDFREKMAKLMYQYHRALPTEQNDPGDITDTVGTAVDTMDPKAARLTILQAVADGKLSPEDAEKALF